MDQFICLSSHYGLVVVLLVSFNAMGLHKNKIKTHCNNISKFIFSNVGVPFVSKEKELR